MIFNVTLEQVNEALKEIREVGTVQVEGNSGSFSASGVEGRFQFNEYKEELKIVIDDKPWLATDSMIEQRIRQFFNT